MQNGLIGAAVLAATLLSGNAAAQDSPADTTAPASWYMSLDMSLGGASDPVAGDAYQADHGLEVGGSLGLGYAFGPLRLEGQLRYESFLLNNLNPYPGSPVTATDTYGNLSGFGAMGNVFFDFGAPAGLRPFVGVGGGLLHLKADYRDIGCFICFGGGPVVVGGSDTVTARQAMAGLRFPQSGGLGEWFVGYRYLKTDDIRLSIVGGGPVTQEGVESHSFLVGALYRLPP